jgi:hypothetical protein
MDRPWKVVTAFIGVFIAGAVFGGLFTIGASARRMQLQRPVQPLPAAEGAQTKVAGPAAPATVSPRTSPLTPQLMRQFTRELGLTAEQREKILPIVGRAGEDFQRLRDEETRRRQENVADVARVNERMYVDVSGVLTPEQRTKLQEMRQRFEDRVQADRQRRAEKEAEFRAAQKAAERPATKTGAEKQK